MSNLVASQDTLLDYFERVRDVFESVPGARQDVFLDMAGTVLRLRFASPSLAGRLTPALAHQVIAETSPHFTLCLWDTTPMPPPVWTGYGRRGELAGAPSKRIQAAFCHPGSTLSLLDRERRLALYWTPQAEAQPAWERCAPLRTLLAWTLQQPGQHLVHGAGVGRSEGGVLLAGKGGSGKSTSALSCLASPALGYAGDDYTLLTSEPTVHSVYNTARVCHDNLFRVSHLQDAVNDTDDSEKAMLLLHPRHRDRLLQHFPLRAVLLPVLGADHTELSPATPLDGVQALALSTMAQVPCAGHALVDTVRTVLERVPCYFLHLGPEPVADLIESFLA